MGCVSIALLGGTEHRGVELTMRRVLWVVGWECIGPREPINKFILRLAFAADIMSGFIHQTINIE